jgi:hypothetical protein
MNQQDLDNWNDILAKLRARTSHQVFNERVAVEIELMIAALAAAQQERDDQSRWRQQLAGTLESTQADLAAANALLKELHDASFVAWQTSPEGRAYLDRINAALMNAKVALEYHQQQTRPINQTKDAIAAIDGVLRDV